MRGVAYLLGKTEPLPEFPAAMRAAGTPADDTRELSSFEDVAADKVAETWSQVVALRIDAVLALFFAIVLWVVIADMLRMTLRMRSGKPVLPLSESAYVRSDPRLAVGTAH